MYTHFLYCESWYPETRPTFRIPSTASGHSLFRAGGIKWPVTPVQFSYGSESSGGRKWLCCAYTVVGGRQGCTCSAYCRKWCTCSTQLPVAASFCGRSSLKASKGSAQAWQIWWVTGWLEVHRAILILRWWRSRCQGLVATPCPYWSTYRLQCQVVYL